MYKVYEVVIYRKVVSLALLEWTIDVDASIDEIGHEPIQPRRQNSASHS